MEHESRTTTQNKVKDCHMQWFHAREQFFVGGDVTNFDVVKLVSHVDAQKRNADITNNAKEVHPCLVGGKGSQLMVVVAYHGFNDHQTSKVSCNNIFLCDTIVPMS